MQAAGKAVTSLGLKAVTTLNPANYDFTFDAVGYLERQDGNLFTGTGVKAQGVKDIAVARNSVQAFFQVTPPWPRTRSLTLGTDVASQISNGMHYDNYFNDKEQKYYPWYVGGTTSTLLFICGNVLGTAAVDYRKQLTAKTEAEARVEGKNIDAEAEKYTEDLARRFLTALTTNNACTAAASPTQAAAAALGVRLSCQSNFSDAGLVVCTASPVNARSDATITYQWSLDGQSQSATGTELRLTNVKPGDHRVTVTATDSRNRLTSQPQSVSFNKAAPSSGSGGGNTGGSGGSGTTSGGSSPGGGDTLIGVLILLGGAAVTIAVAGAAGGAVIRTIRGPRPGGGGQPGGTAKPPSRPSGLPGGSAPPARPPGYKPPSARPPDLPGGGGTTLPPRPANLPEGGVSTLPPRPTSGPEALAGGGGLLGTVVDSLSPLGAPVMTGTTVESPPSGGREDESRDQAQDELVLTVDPASVTIHGDGQNPAAVQISVTRRKGQRTEDAYGSVKISTAVSDKRVTADTRRPRSVDISALYLGTLPVEATVTVTAVEKIFPFRTLSANVQVKVTPVTANVNVYAWKDGFFWQQFQEVLAQSAGELAGSVTCIDRRRSEKILTGETEAYEPLVLTNPLTGPDTLTSLSQVRLPVAFAHCRVALNFDGGGWSHVGETVTDARGEFSMALPAKLPQLFGADRWRHPLAQTVELDLHPDTDRDLGLFERTAQEICPAPIYAAARANANQYPHTFFRQLCAAPESDVPRLFAALHLFRYAIAYAGMYRHEFQALRTRAEMAVDDFFKALVDLIVEFTSIWEHILKLRYYINPVNWAVKLGNAFAGSRFAGLITAAANKVGLPSLSSVMSAVRTRFTAAWAWVAEKCGRVPGNLEQRGRGIVEGAFDPNVGAWEAQARTLNNPIAQFLAQMLVWMWGCTLFLMNMAKGLFYLAAALGVAVVLLLCKVFAAGASSLATAFGWVSNSVLYEVKRALGYGEFGGMAQQWMAEGLEEATGQWGADVANKLSAMLHRLWSDPHENAEAVSTTGIMQSIKSCMLDEAEFDQHALRLILRAHTFSVQLDVPPDWEQNVMRVRASRLQAMRDYQANSEDTEQFETYVAYFRLLLKVAQLTTWVYAAFRKAGTKLLGWIETAFKAELGDLTRWVETLFWFGGLLDKISNLVEVWVLRGPILASELFLLYQERTEIHLSILGLYDKGGQS